MIQVTDASECSPHCGPRHGKADYRMMCVQHEAGSLPLVNTGSVSRHSGNVAGASAKKLTKGWVEEQFYAGPRAQA